MKFNEKIKNLRLERDMTQEDLAKVCYVSRNAVSKWETGKGYPNLDSLQIISKTFNVSIDNLLSEEDLCILTVDNREKSIVNYNLLMDIISFFLYSVIGIVIPILMFYYDPTSPLAYFLFIGPFSFLILAVMLAFFTRNHQHTAIATLLGVIPIFIYYEYVNITSGIWSLIVYLAFLGMFSIVYFLKNKKELKTFDKKWQIIAIILLILTVISYLTLNIIGIIENITAGIQWYGVILMYFFIFFGIFFIEIYWLTIIKRCNKDN